MSEMKPAAWCLMTGDGQIINGVHTELRLAEQYRHRRASDTLTSLFTADQLAEAVAAERERCAKVCEGLISEIFHERGSSPEPETGGVSVSSEDQEIITYLEEAIKAIRSATK